MPPGGGSQSARAKKTMSNWSFWETRFWAWSSQRSSSAVFPIFMKASGRASAPAWSAGAIWRRWPRRSTWEVICGWGGERNEAGAGRSLRLLANCVEAIIAALYLDGGLAPVEAFVNEHVVAPYVNDLRQALDRGSPWATTRLRCKSCCKRRRPGRRIMCSRQRAGPITASGSWWK